VADEAEEEGWKEVGGAEGATASPSFGTVIDFLILWFCVVFYLKGT